MTEAKIVFSADDRTQAAFASIRSSMDSMMPKMQGLSASFNVFNQSLQLAKDLAAAMLGPVHAVNAFNDLRDATGASIENISALDRIARQTGGDFSTVSTTLVKFNQALTKTGDGSDDSVRVFKALGLSLEDLKKADPAEALLKTAIAFQGFAKDGEAARASQILFAKSIQEVAPFLKNLAEAGELVATTTTEAAEQAEVFNKQLLHMQATTTDAGRSIAMGVVPTMSQLADEFLGLKESGGAVPVAIDAIKITLQTLAVVGANTVFVFKAMGNEIGGIAAQLASLATGDIKGFHAISEAVKADADHARKELDAFEKRILEGPKLSDLAGSAGSLGKKPSLDIGLKFDKSEVKLYTNALQGLEMQMSGLGHQTEAEKTIYKLTEGSLKSLTDAHKANVLAVAGEVDIMKTAVLVAAYQNKRAEEFMTLQDLATASKEDFVRSTRLSIDAMSFEVDLIGKSAIETQKLTAARNIDLDVQQRALELRRQAGDDPEKQKAVEDEIADLKRIGEARKKSVEEAFTSANRVKMDWSSGMKTGLAKYVDDVGNAAKQTDDLVTNAFKGMEDALVEFVKTGKLDFSSLTDSIISDLIRIQVRQNITGRLATGMQDFNWGSLFSGGSGGGSIGGGGAGGTDFMGSYAGGGSTGNGPRSGGLDGQGGFWAVMHPQETVIDHAQGQSAGAQISNTWVLNIGDHQERAVIYRNVDMMLRNNSAQLVDQLTRTGRL